MKRKLIPLLSVFLTTAVTVVAGELVFRFMDGLPVFAFELPEQSKNFDAPILSGRKKSADFIDKIEVANGVSRNWYQNEPPPVERFPVSDELLKWRELLRNSGISEFEFYKMWNANLVESQGLCSKNSFFGRFPNRIFVFKPLSDSTYPKYRFFFNQTTPLGLTTNRYGWRGEQISLEKPPNTIRVAFLGASTTISAHGYPHAYPEYVEHWLNIWSADQGYGYNFEIINAGREGINSMDIAAVMEEEVEPLNADIIVYYEGSNQFNLNNIASFPADFLPYKRTGLEAKSDEAIFMGKYSAIARRINSLTAKADEAKGVNYHIDWPDGLNEADPDINFETLPVNLTQILADLDRIHASAKRKGSTFVLSSFIWLASDDLDMDPIKHQSIYRYLNEGMYPFTYTDIERLANFQNRVFRKYAFERNIEFIDVAAIYPREPDLFDDAIHNTRDGVKLRAWVVLQELIPIIEAKIVSGELPRTIEKQEIGHPLDNLQKETWIFDCESHSNLDSKLVLNLKDIRKNNDQSQVAINDDHVQILTANIPNYYAAELSLPEIEISSTEEKYWTLDIRVSVRGEGVEIGVLNIDKDMFLAKKVVEPNRASDTQLITLEWGGNNAFKPSNLIFANGKNQTSDEIFVYSVELSIGTTKSRLSKLQNLRFDFE